MIRKKGDMPKSALETCFINEEMLCFLLQVCPICAALPGGDPNHMTDDFAAHLTLEHRAPKEFISFQLTLQLSLLGIC